jgi:hypothetical protein
MKERPLFFQDLGFLGPDILKKEQRLLGYKSAVMAGNRLIRRGPFSFLTLESLKSFSAEFLHQVKQFQSFEKILFLGTPDVLKAAQALCAPFQSWVWIEDSFPRICFLSTLDAETFWELMSVNRPQSTGVVVIADHDQLEVLLPLMRCLEYWKGLIPDHDFSKHFLMMVPGHSRLLFSIAQEMKLSYLPYIEDSVPLCFSKMALFPAMLLGFKPESFFEGIISTGNQFFNSLLKMPIEAAGIMWSFIQTGEISHQLFVSYADFFHPWISWYQNLWGQFFQQYAFCFAPMSAHALGPIDQLHQSVDLNQHQFWTLLLEMQNPYEGFKPEIWDRLPEVQKFASVSLPHLIKKRFQDQTEYLLSRNQPFRILKVHVLNEKTLGALFMNSLLEMTLLLELLTLSMKK